MTRQAGLSVQWLRRLREGLERKGYLRVVACHDGATGVQTESAYDFAGLLGALEAAILAGPAAPNPIEEPDDGAAPTEPIADSSFVARFGRVVARAGVAAIPQALFTYQQALGLSAQQVWLIAYILCHRWSTALPFPSLKRMAERTGYSERQIHNVKEELVVRGYLTLVARHQANGGRAANGYDFGALFGALVEQLAADGRAGPPEPGPAPPAVVHPLGTRRGRRAAAGVPVGSGSYVTPGAGRGEVAQPATFPDPGETVVPWVGATAVPPPGETVVPWPGATARPQGEATSIPGGGETEMQRVRETLLPRGGNNNSVGRGSTTSAAGHNTGSAGAQRCCGRGQRYCRAEGKGRFSERRSSSRRIRSKE
jgi:hypothetical protein